MGNKNEVGNREKWKQCDFNIGFNDFDIGGCLTLTFVSWFHA